MPMKSAFSYRAAKNIEDRIAMRVAAGKRIQGNELKVLKNNALLNVQYLKVCCI